MDKIKVLLAVPDLEGLGVQHDIRSLMHNWDHERFDARLLLHSRTGSFADQFPESVKAIEIDKYVINIKKIKVLSRLGGYRKAINSFKPDVVISFVPFSNYGCIYAKIFGRHKFKLVISEHAHVTAAMSDPENMNTLFMKIYRLTFPYLYNSRFVDAVKCIAKESMEDLINNHKIKKGKVVLIYNPVEMEEIKNLAQEEITEPWFKEVSEKNIPILINVGRLTVQKRQDILIRAFAKVYKQLPCQLIIVGGGDQEILRQIAAKAGVEQNVHFAGFQKNPWKWVARADLFVLSSLWEGLPCVLTESMTLGVPVVSVRCPSGPTEMLLNGEAGYLCEVGNINDLAEKIIYALTHKEETAKKVAIGQENLFRFNPKRAAENYQQLVLRLAGEK